MSDETLAKRVATEIGDTFICYDNMAPVEQWTRVLRVLAEGGWTLGRLDDPVRLDHPLAVEAAAKALFDLAHGSPRPDRELFGAYQSDEFYRAQARAALLAAAEARPEGTE